MALVGWLVFTVIALSILYGLYGEAHDHHVGEATAAVYTSLHRTAWALCVAWVIVACVTGYGGK